MLVIVSVGCSCGFLPLELVILTPKTNEKRTEITQPNIVCCVQCSSNQKKSMVGGKKFRQWSYRPLPWDSPFPITALPTSIISFLVTGQVLQKILMWSDSRTECWVGNTFFSPLNSPSMCNGCTDSFLYLINTLTQLCMWGPVTIIITLLLCHS